MPNNFDISEVPLCTQAGQGPKCPLTFSVNLKNYTFYAVSANSLSPAGIHQPMRMEKKEKEGKQLSFKEMT